MNKRFDQPFFVGYNNPNFRGARYGYLPPIEPPLCEEQEQEVVHIHKHLNDKLEGDLLMRIATLKAKLADLENELQEHFEFHTDKKKRTGGRFA